jgi:hypothetical protein
MNDLSSILAAYPSPAPEQLALIPLAQAADSADAGSPVLLLLAVGMLVIALRCMKSALAPIAVIVKSVLAAGAAALLILVALGLLILSVAAGLI